MVSPPEHGVPGCVATVRNARGMSAVPWEVWTVAALAPSWLLYPVLYDPFLYERRHLMVVTVVLAIVPSLIALLFVSGDLRAGAYFNDSAHTALLHGAPPRPRQSCARPPPPASPPP